MANLIKLLRSSDRRFIEDDETIAVSSSRYFSENFRLLEGQDPAIFDPYEATVIRSHDPITSIGLTGRDHSILREMGFSGIDNRANVHASGNISIRRARIFFMFCLSFGDRNILQSIFNGRPNILEEDIYDCAFRIRYFDSFERALWEEAYIKSLNARLKDIFLLPLSGPVTYGSLANNLSREAIRRPSPFFKRSDLAWQNEFRMVFEPRSGKRLEDRIIVTVPNIRRFISWNF